MAAPPELAVTSCADEALLSRATRARHWASSGAASRVQPVATPPSPSCAPRRDPGEPAGGHGAGRVLSRRRSCERIAEALVRWSRGGVELAGMASRKRCSRCGYVKNIEAFSRDRTTKDGRDPWCKACKGTYDLGYRAGVRRAKST
jgi:hypothetical protein